MWITLNSSSSTWDLDWMKVKFSIILFFIFGFIAKPKSLVFKMMSWTALESSHTNWRPEQPLYSLKRWIHHDMCLWNESNLISLEWMHFYFRIVKYHIWQIYKTCIPITILLDLFTGQEFMQERGAPLPGNVRHNWGNSTFKRKKKKNGKEKKRKRRREKDRERRKT